MKKIIEIIKGLFKRRKLHGLEQVLDIAEKKGYYASHVIIKGGLVDITLQAHIKQERKKIPVGNVDKGKLDKATFLDPSADNWPE